MILAYPVDKMPRFVIKWVMGRFKICAFTHPSSIYSDTEAQIKEAIAHGDLKIVTLTPTKGVNLDLLQD